MKRIYTTSEGDTADYIAWKIYRSTEASVVEALIAANKGLSDSGPLLSAGVVINLPEIATPSKNQGVRLWD